MEKLKNFVIWLDGFLEDKNSLNEQQTKKISDKLNMLFEHEADSQQTNESSKPNSSANVYINPNESQLFRC